MEKPSQTLARMNDEKNLRFRTAFVIEPLHDLSALLKYADRIEFLSSGYEQVDGLMTLIGKKLEDFDNNLDVLIPVGRVVASLVTGIFLSKIASPVTLGIFRDKDYYFIKLNLNSGNSL